jgi:hypothetical protein
MKPKTGRGSSTKSFTAPRAKFNPKPNIPFWGVPRRTLCPREKTIRSRNSSISPRASPARAHGDSSQDGSERALNSPENQCSIGFQPVFCRTERCFPTIRRSPRVVYKAQSRSFPTIHGSGAGHILIFRPRPVGRNPRKPLLTSLPAWTRPKQASADHF